MIQFKRGKTKNWRLQVKPLADGQPGYDRDKHKIKIGDGKTNWQLLPYASGLAEEEILNSELLAKARYLLDPEDGTIFTYGTDAPDKYTVGKVYLQYYETASEADYIVDFGSSGIWTYQIWNSGIAKCWGTLNITASIQDSFDSGSLFCDSKNNAMTAVDYPVNFKNTPVETATLQNEGKLVWICNYESNTAKKSGAYRLISPDKHTDATYNLNLSVEGFI